MNWLRYTFLVVLFAFATALAATACRQAQAEAPKPQGGLIVAFTGIVGLVQDKPGGKVTAIMPNGYAPRLSKRVTGTKDSIIPRHRAFVRYPLQCLAATPTGPARTFRDRGTRTEYGIEYLEGRRVSVETHGAPDTGLTLGPEVIRFSEICGGVLDSKHLMAPKKTNIAALVEVPSAYLGSDHNNKSWLFDPPKEGGVAKAGYLAQEVFLRLQPSGSSIVLHFADLETGRPESDLALTASDQCRKVWIGNSWEDDVYMEHDTDDQDYDTHFELYYGLLDSKIQTLHKHSGDYHIPKRVRSKDGMTKAMHGSNCPPVKF
jgi:hypothetical protein